MKNKKAKLSALEKVKIKSIKKSLSISWMLV
jgi:hypothetical protein